MSQTSFLPIAAFDLIEKKDADAALQTLPAVPPRTSATLRQPSKTWDRPRKAPYEAKSVWAYEVEA
jgi:hypothetical protein